MAELDIDTVLPGHGEVGTPADLNDYAQYFQDLNDAVAAGIADDKTLDELKASIALEDYKEWGRYETQLSLNVADVYGLLTTGSE